MTVSSTYQNVGIRQFWIPPGETELVATRKGISIGKTEFRKLKDLQEELHQAVPELETVSKCLDNPSHANQLGALSCRECNPNDFENW